MGHDRRLSAPRLAAGAVVVLTLASVVGPSVWRSSPVVAAAPRVSAVASAGVTALPAPPMPSAAEGGPAQGIPIPGQRGLFVVDQPPLPPGLAPEAFDRPPPDVRVDMYTVDWDAGFEDPAWFGAAE